MTRRERFVRATVDYWDLVLAIAAAIAIAVLGVAGTLKPDDLTTATLAVLAALAGVTVRERYERRKSADEARALAQAAVEDKPWHVLEETLHWDITSGDVSTVYDDRELYFLDSETVAVWEFFSAPANGKVVEYKCEGGPLGARVLREWPVMEETFMLDAVGGRSYRVISTAGIWKRGDRVVWKSMRKQEGLFPAREEAVTKNVLMPTDRLTLRVTWPTALPPTNVRLLRGNEPEVHLKPQKDRNGRLCVVQNIRRAQVGDVINIRWDWR